jgi:hypothetical protein
MVYIIVYAFKFKSVPVPIPVIMHQVLEFEEEKKTCVIFFRG